MLGVSSLRYLARHRWQAGLAVLGIALGVAVVIAVDIATTSAERAFVLSAETLFGRTTHSITGGANGIPERFYRELRVTHGFRETAPVVEGYVNAADYPARQFQLIGIDIFADSALRSFTAEHTGGSYIKALLSRPTTGLLLADTASQLGVSVGDTIALEIAGRHHALTIVGLLQPRLRTTRYALESVVITDISTAQELLGMTGRLTRIDLALPDELRRDKRLEELRALLPPGLTLTDAAGRIAGMQQMTHAFNVNLSALGLLALIVGLFLIYNTMTFSVVQRRTLIGIYRALGVMRREIFFLVMTEALVIGLAGTLAGTALGIALGNGLVHLVTRTINDLYFVVTVRELALDPVTLGKGMLLGIAGSLLAAAAPAREATTTTASSALTRSSQETGLHALLPRIVVIAVVMIGLALALIFGSTRSLALAYAGLFLGIVGAALLVPMATIAIMRVCLPVAAKILGVFGRMAARGVVAALSRTGVAIAALTVAIAATIGMGVMIDSFRTTVDHWLGGYLRADIYVTPAGDSGGFLEPEIIDRLRQTRGVASLSTGRYLQLESMSGTTTMMALDLPPPALPAFRFKEGDPDKVWPAFATEDVVIVTEPYAWHNRVGVGDSVELPTDHGMETFRIAGVFYHYGSDRGLVMMSRRTYERHWNDRAITSVGIYVSPGTDAAAVRAALTRNTGGEQALSMRLNREVHEQSLAIFDRTFAVTNVLRLLAIVVAFVGVLSALLALQLERSRELAVLRAIGLTPSDVWKLVMTQTGLVGFTAGVLAIPFGLLLSLALIYVVNLRSFGWTIQLSIDAAILAHAVLLAIVAALLAGVVPAWRMMKTSPAMALRND